jgi:subtilisin family serine protease
VQPDGQVTIAATRRPDRVDADLSPPRTSTASTSASMSTCGHRYRHPLNHPDLNVAGATTARPGLGRRGHGTHVAGTIGALDNGIGVVGVAPGARLWAVRVLNNQGSGTWSGIICGIDWATGKRDANGQRTIEVANMSLGGGGADSTCGGSDAMHNAICTSVTAGITYVVAAGNNNANANTFVPATYAEVITVSALADFINPAAVRRPPRDVRYPLLNFGDVDLWRRASASSRLVSSG